MQLIGMLDSPYVRRVAITLKALDIPFEHHPLSVFRDFERFQSINPVVKAPTLVLDDDRWLMDSTLIIDYLETLAGPAKTLMPHVLNLRIEALHLIGLGLAACEKAVQIVYEQQLRPEGKQHAPWLERVSGQLLAACSQIEAQLARQPLPRNGQLQQDGITLAVAWSFIQLMVSEYVDPAQFPHLAGYAAYAEGLGVFQDTPML